MSKPESERSAVWPDQPSKSFSPSCMYLCNLTVQLYHANRFYSSHRIHPIIPTLRRRRRQRRGTLFDSASIFQSSRYIKSSTWGLYSNKACMPFSRWGEVTKKASLCSQSNEPPSLFCKKTKTNICVFSRANTFSAAPVTPLPKSQSRV